MKVLLDTNALTALWRGDERILEALDQAEAGSPVRYRSG